MGLWGKIFGQFVDVIEWLDDSNNTLVYRFERYGNEIQYGAKLTVREGQIAVFVNEGQVADVLTPGLYQLETKNLPVLTALRHWDHGFNSPFKAEVYFCNTRRFTDLKWGTKNPLMMRDAEFGAVRIRAFGSYVIRIRDASCFIREIVGTDGHFTLEEISDQLRNLIASRFATVVAESRIPVLDMAANYDQFGDFLTSRIAPEFAAYGLELTKMLIENISLPPGVEKALDKRTSIGIVGNLDDFMKFQAADALEVAAKNPSGGSGADAMNMGMGLAMAQTLSQSLNRPSSSTASPTIPQIVAPPPLPGRKKYHVAINNQSQGPYGLEELKESVLAGNLQPKTLVWTSGMAQWMPASEVSDLSVLFPQTQQPPPLPNND